MAGIDDTPTNKNQVPSRIATLIASPLFQLAIEVIDQKRRKKTKHPVKAKREKKTKPRGSPAVADSIHTAEYLAHEAAVIAEKEEQLREQQRQLARDNNRRKKNGEPSRPIGRPKVASRMLPVPVIAQGVRRDNATVYALQSFDPVINRKNPRWAGYRPYWLLEAEKTVRIYPEDFRHIRQHLNNMTLEQCAAFLRVETATITKWEAGIDAIPHLAFIALRQTYDLQFLPHQLKEWADWKIIGGGSDVGMLRDQITGVMFRPADLRTWRYVRADADRLNRENIALKKQVAEMQAENTALRTLYLSNGVTKELHSMHDRIAALLANINTAEITELDFITKAPQLKEKIA